MKTIEADICIIGSGMGGGTLALRLADCGLKPLVVEAGSETGESADVSHEHVGRPFGLEKSRAIELGGSTNLWHGVVSPLDRRDFTRAPDGTHDGWPLSYEDMSRYWVKALEFLDFDRPELSTFGQLEQALQRRANDIKFDRNSLSPKLFRVMGNPRRLKHDLKRAADAGKLRLMTGATALECVADANDHSRVASVIAGQGVDKVEIRANRFVVAAGALETPRLLLNSGSFGAQGLGNAAGNVGRYLMDHPMGFLGKISFRRPVRAPLFSDMRERRGNRLRVGIVPAPNSTFANSNIYLRPAIPGATPEVENEILVSLIAIRRAKDLGIRHIKSLLRNPKVLYRIIANRYVLPIRYRAADLFFVTEQTPDRASRVSLGTKLDRYGYPIARIDWRISESDNENVARFLAHLVAEGLNGDEYRFDELPSIEKWIRTFTSAAHHLGTARMSSEPAQGVVDTNLRVHGMKNIWVCDGSVFPSGGNANPSLTICALSLRLSDHLMNGCA